MQPEVIVHPKIETWKTQLAVFRAELQGLLETPVEKYPLETQEMKEWLVQKINKEGMTSESLKDFVLIHLDQSSAQSLSDSTDYISHLASISLTNYSSECKHEITSLIIYADKT